MTPQSTNANEGSNDPLAYFRQRYSTKPSEQVGLVGKSSHFKAVSDPTRAITGRIRSDMARSNHVLSDHSDHVDKRSDHENLSNINGYPTYPTIPTKNHASLDESGGQRQVMPKCAICGTSIPTEYVPGVPTDGGRLAHRSCVELGLPSRMLSSCSGRAC